MKRPASIKILTWAIAASVLLAGVLFWTTKTQVQREPALPYKDSFSKGQMNEWKAYGGLWMVKNGAVVNVSDERGAKLLAGSPRWKDYELSAEVKLVANDSDVGVIAEATDEELGVDSYSGFYAGLRTRDNSLVLGRADHGWNEYKTQVIPGGVDPSHWYRITLASKDCVVRATAYTIGTSSQSTLELREDKCLPAGKIGLRSYSTGGAWRNVTAKPIVSWDPKSLPLSQTLSSGVAMADRPAVEVPVHEREGDAKPPLAIRDLLLASGPGGVSVRGTVVLTSPALYVEDGTGAVHLDAPSTPSLRVGDEVEISGHVERKYFDAVLRQASIKFLWAGDPRPPISVAAGQAAAGTVAGRFIETEGLLRSVSQTPDKLGTTLTMTAGGQVFLAVLRTPTGGPILPELQENSLLRLRGICSLDPESTGLDVPFAVLLRSPEDIQVLKGPPWWSGWRLAAILVGGMIVSLTVYTLALRVRHAQLQAVLAERGRFAHEIHDTMAQSFAGIEFQLRAISRTLPTGGKDQIQSQVDYASQMVRHSHEEARRNIAVLRPETLMETDILTHLRRGADHLVSGGGVSIQTRSVGEVRLVPLALKDAAFRVGLEALANAVLHGRPSQIVLTVEYTASHFVLEVSDNGCGFALKSPQRGFGLAGMRTRAQRVGAELEIESEPGRGSRVRFRASLRMRGQIRLWSGFLALVGVGVMPDA